jgi:hypothetical protein
MLLKNTLRAFLIKAHEKDPEWGVYLKRFWDEGHQKVPNTDKDTVSTYPDVTMLYLYEKDPVFKEKIDNNFEAYKKTQNPLDTNKVKLPEIRIKSIEKVLSTTIPQNEFMSRLKAKEELGIKGSKAEKEVIKDYAKEKEPDFHSYLKNKNLNSETLTKITGIHNVSDSIDNAEVSLDFANDFSKDRDPSFPYSVNIRAESEQLSVDRSIMFKKNGSMELVMNSMSVNNQQKGFGFKMLYGSIDTAKRLGVENITTFAERHDGANYPQIGYKVWPKMGYDFPIPEDVLSKLKHQAPDTYLRLSELEEDSKYGSQYTIQNLYSLGKDAVEFWEKEGTSTNLEFSLKDGSKNLSILNKYFARK